jgi:sugar lactone lactonase YvrE
VPEPEIAIADVRFAESPRWHDDELWFSETLAQRVVRLTGSGELREVGRLDGDRPSGLGWDQEGRLLIVAMFQRALLRQDQDGSLSCFADLSGITVGLINDMVVDRQGRAFIGNLGYDWLTAPPGPGSLIRVDPDGHAAEVAGGLRGPNGIVIADDGHTLVVAELEASKLSAFDLDPDTGALSNYRLWADVHPMRPDGCCLDAEGCIWFGSPRDSAFVRVAEGGEVRGRIETPGRRSVAPMLGGADGRRLYLCTATHGEMDWFNDTVENCWIETVDVGTPHAGLP